MDVPAPRTGAGPPAALATARTLFLLLASAVVRADYRALDRHRVARAWRLTHTAAGWRARSLAASADSVTRC
jgi:hypothetical protein